MSLVFIAADGAAPAGAARGTGKTGPEGAARPGGESGDEAVIADGRYRIRKESLGGSCLFRLGTAGAAGDGGFSFEITFDRVDLDRIEGELGNRDRRLTFSLWVQERLNGRLTLIIPGGEGCAEAFARLCAFFNVAESQLAETMRRAR